MHYTYVFFNVYYLEQNAVLIAVGNNYRIQAGWYLLLRKLEVYENLLKEIVFYDTISAWQK